MTSLSRVTEILAKLVSFDTTSRGPNLPLIEWVEDFLAPLGAELVRLPDASGGKANLWARIGPDAPGGVVLSGHTDVVPVDGQPWTSDPWTVREADGRLYGRGVSDMKGFIALCLAHAKALSEMRLDRPVHFAFSFDEEVGCAGVAPMVREIIDRGAAPSLVWVGEPTLWGVVSAHKGIRDYEVKVTGKAAHSSDPRIGASAVHEALELMNVLRGIARTAEATAPAESVFDPSWTTLTIGIVHGGTAPNILARECSFVFDMRPVPGSDPDGMIAPFMEAVAKADARLKAWGEECGVGVIKNADAPPLEYVADSPAERFLRDLTGDNAVRTASYATEAGQFQRAGMPAVICGPGSIEQAHKTDEWIAVSELQKGLHVFARFLERLAS